MNRLQNDNPPTLIDDGFYDEVPACTCEKAPPHKGSCPAYQAFKQSEVRRAYGYEPAPEPPAKLGCLALLLLVAVLWLVMGCRMAEEVR